MYRVTQRTMYQGFIQQMNSNLAAYMESNMQGATMKKVNAPSDDPAGMAHILNYRSSIEKTKQFESNVSTALGWLKLSEGVFSQVDTALIRAKELASQAATGTLSPENREQVCFEARQILERMINYANSEFAGRYIFSGQSIDTPPYRLGLGASSADPNLKDVNFQVNGAADSSIVLRFETNGTLPPTTPDPPDGTTGDLEYSYSKDGGKTWEKGVLWVGHDDTIKIDSVEIKIPPMAPPAKVTAYDPTKTFTENNGTSLVIRPTAIYQGYDQTVPPDVSTYGSISPNISLKPDGLFQSNVQVRMDSNVDFTLAPQDVTYSYSTDNGKNWVTTKVQTSIPLTGSADSTLRLPIPGGFFDLDSSHIGPPPSASTIPAGTQFTITPQRAHIDYESTQNNYVMVNGIGKDIFGGLYTPQGSSMSVSAFNGEGKNLFETLGKLIGSLETNNQEGCARALDDIKDSMQQMLLTSANVGGRINRLESTKDMLSNSKLDQQERMSQIEDVDITELVNRLAMQQMAYQTILQSSSMIMKLNLTNFI